MIGNGNSTFLWHCDTPSHIRSLHVLWLVDQNQGNEPVVYMGALQMALERPCGLWHQGTDLGKTVVTLVLNLLRGRKAIKAGEIVIPHPTSIVYMGDLGRIINPIRYH